MNDQKTVLGAGYAQVQAENDFNRARNKALLSRMRHFMHTGRDELLSLEDVKDILKPKNEHYRGIQQVPIALIVGSEGRYRDFNRYFLPRSEFLRSRWKRVDQAQIQDIILPPIQLYEIGGAYFVRDGNHRVSVARSQGVEMIDAEVISLSSEIEIKPGMTTEDLKNAVIGYEKRLFYEKTRFGEITGDQNLNFTTPGRYDLVYRHILDHKYFLNQGKAEEIPLVKGILSWYEKVYSPIIYIINENFLTASFPGWTPSDLYVWIVKHWDFLKKKNGLHYSLAGAARDFSIKYGNSKGRFFRVLAAFIGRLFRRRQ